MALPPLLLTATKALNLDDDLAQFEALAELKTKFKAIHGLSDVQALLDAIASGLDSQTVTQIFTALNLADQQARVVAFVDKVKDAGTVPAKYAGLLEPLSHYPLGDDSDASAVKWTVSGSGAPKTVKTGYALKLDGQATLTLDSAASAPDVTPAQRRLLIGAAGEVQAGADGTLPYQFGAVSAKTSASAHVDLDYYYAPKTDPLFALAVVERLPRLANPFDLDSVWSALHDSGADLSEIVCGFKGDADASIDISFADARGLAKGVVLDTGFKVGVKINLAATYALTLARTDAGVRVKLSRGDVAASAFNGSLDLGVDVSSLTRPVAAALTRAADDWDKALDTIKPYLTPGALLRAAALKPLDQAVTQIIKDAGLRQAVIADLTAALGPSAVNDSKTIDWLSTQIAGAISRGQVLVDGQLTPAVDRVMALLAGTLPAAAAFGPQLRDLVAAQVKSLEDGLQAAVDKQLKVGADELKAALNAVQINTSKWAAKLDKALAPVRDLLNRYDALFHQIVDLAKTAAEKKITARLYREETRRLETGVEVAGEFTALNAETRALFQAIVRGRLQPLADLFDNPSATTGFTLQADASSLSSHSQFGSTDGAEIAFVNVLVNATKVVKGDVKVAVDGQGNVHVTADGEITKALASWFNTKKASFNSAYQVVQARRMADAADTAKAGGQAAVPPSMDISIGAVYIDKAFSQDDVERFIRGLVDAGLVGQDVQAKAVTAYQGWAAAAAGGKITCEISAVLRLKNDDLQNILKLAVYPDETVVKAGLEALQQTKVIKPDAFVSGARMVAGQWDTTPHPPTPAEPEDCVPIVLGYADKAENGLGLSEKVPDREPTLANVVMAKASDDAILLRFLRDAYQLKCLSSLFTAINGVYQVPPGQGAQWTKAYEKQERLMLASAEEWLTVFKDVATWRKGDITPVTLAFMRAVHKLAGGQMIVTMTWTKAGAPQVVSFG